MPYHCSNCKKKSLKEEVIKNHCKTTGHTYKLQTCSTCNRFFGSVYDLHNHNMSLHPELGNYMGLKMRGSHKHREKKRKFKATYGAGPGANRCQVCHKEFKTASGCYNHVRAVHGRVSTNSRPTSATADIVGQGEENLDGYFDDDEFAAGDEGVLGFQLAWVERVPNPSFGDVPSEVTPGPPLFQAEIQNLAAALRALEFDGRIGDQPAI